MSPENAEAMNEQTLHAIRVHEEVRSYLTSAIKNQQDVFSTALWIHSHMNKNKDQYLDSQILAVLHETVFDMWTEGRPITNLSRNILQVDCDKAIADLKYSAAHPRNPGPSVLAFNQAAEHLRERCVVDVKKLVPWNNIPYSEVREWMFRLTSSTGQYSDSPILLKFTEIPAVSNDTVFETPRQLSVEEARRVRLARHAFDVRHYEQHEEYIYKVMRNTGAHIADSDTPAVVEEFLTTRTAEFAQWIHMLRAQVLEAFGAPEAEDGVIQQMLEDFFSSLIYALSRVYMKMCIDLFEESKFNEESIQKLYVLVQGQTYLVNFERVFANFLILPHAPDEMKNILDFFATKDMAKLCERSIAFTIPFSTLFNTHSTGEQK